jgi:aryl-alcohol dehydrogenase-like predicted oxidoreductase
MHMKYNVLGRTGLQVSRLGFGGLFIASFASELTAAQEAIRRARACGINYFDTAPMYANSEQVLGTVLGELEQPLIVSTKLGGRPTPFDPRSAEQLRQSMEMSLQVLKRDSVDMLLIHEPDRPGQFDWWTDWAEVYGPVLEVLDGFRRDGIVKYIGLGGTTAYELAHLCRSGKFDVVLTAFNYSLLWREAAIEVIPAARSQNMGIIAGSPLQQGALARRFDAVMDDPRVYWLSKPRREQFKALYALVDECGIALPELAIRFVISNRDIHCVLMGARSADEVEQNVKAVEKGPLPADLLRRLDEIAAMVPFRPYCEPFGLGWRLPAPGSYRGPGEA